MAAVGKWGGRIGYVGNLKGCPYIHCNPPFVHSSNKAWSVPRLLRHSGSGLGVLGGTGAQCTANGKRQRVGGALRYHGPCIFISFSALEQGGTLRGGALPPALSILGCKALLLPLSFPSPLVTRGQIFKKAVKSTAYLFSASFISYRFDIILI